MKAKVDTTHSTMVNGISEMVSLLQVMHLGLAQAVDKVQAPRQGKPNQVVKSYK